MAIFSSLMIDDHDCSDSDSDFSILTVDELVTRLRCCFEDSDFVKLGKILTARDNEIREEIRAKEQEIRKLEIELKKVNREKKEAENEVEKWKVTIQSRVSVLEKEAEELEKRGYADMVSCKRCEKMELEKQVVKVNKSDCQEKRMDSDPAPEGSGKIPAKTIVIIDSDDEDTSKGLAGKQTTSAGNLRQKSSQNVVKRKMNAISAVRNNNRGEKTSMDENLNADGLGFKLQKITHDESSENLVSTSVQNKRGTATKNTLSKSLSNTIDALFSDDSSSSSASDCEDEKDERNWEYELDVYASLIIDNELCLKAICALYRRNYFSSNYQGFNDTIAQRGTTIAKFLTNGDPRGMLKKSVSELLQFDGRALDDCRAIARGYSKQLFNLYKGKDPLFQP